MKAQIASSKNDWDEVVFRCACGDNHFIILQVIDFRDDGLEEP